MKTRMIALVCVVAFIVGSTAPAHAMDDFTPEAMATDTLVVRPMCLAATIVGSAVFLVSLPFVAIAGKTGKTAKALVGKPAKATFVRDMGDLSGVGL